MALYVPVQKSRQPDTDKERKYNSPYFLQKKQRNCNSDFPKAVQGVCENGAYFHWVLV